MSETSPAVTRRSPTRVPLKVWGNAGHQTKRQLDATTNRHDANCLLFNDLSYLVNFTAPSRCDFELNARSEEQKLNSED
jgi:hypothetical protein